MRKLMIAINHGTNEFRLHEGIVDELEKDFWPQLNIEEKSGVLVIPRCVLAIGTSGYWARGISIKEAAQKIWDEGERRDARFYLFLGDETVEFQGMAFVSEQGSHRIELGKFSVRTAKNS